MRQDAAYGARSQKLAGDVADDSFSQPAVAYPPVKDFVCTTGQMETHYDELMRRTVAEVMSEAC
jgi:hypothetical protein